MVTFGKFSGTVFESDGLPTRGDGAYESETYSSEGAGGDFVGGSYMGAKDWLRVIENTDVFEDESLVPEDGSGSELGILEDENEVGNHDELYPPNEERRRMTKNTPDEITDEYRSSNEGPAGDEG